MEKSLLVENQKRNKVLSKKNKTKQNKKTTATKKKEQAKEERKSTILLRKEKKFLCESDWYCQSSMLVSRFRTKKSLLNQSLP